MRVTSAMEAVDELIALVGRNSDIANHADGLSADDLALAELLLGLRFPPSYRRLVAEFGTWDIAGEEFLGVYRTSAMGDRLLGSVHETLDARAMCGLPGSMLVTMFDGMGGLIVLDTTVVDARGESPVLVCTPRRNARVDIEELAADFGTYALGRCTRAVRRWRESS